MNAQELTDAEKDADARHVDADELFGLVRTEETWQLLGEALARHHADGE